MSNLSFGRLTFRSVTLGTSSFCFYSSEVSMGVGRTEVGRGDKLGVSRLGNEFIVSSIGLRLPSLCFHAPRSRLRTAMSVSVGTFTRGGPNGMVTHIGNTLKHSSLFLFVNSTLPGRVGDQ